MDDRAQDLEATVPLQAMLGYLNFSAGKPEARFQKQLNDAYRVLDTHPEPWKALRDLLARKLETLKETAAFRDARQAAAVLALAIDALLPAYRRHHADLLFHQTDRDLFQPFFLARVFEAVLAQGGPWDERDRITDGALRQLNDFVGHRPVAILEGRPRGEPYDHERVRPVPLFLHGAGVAVGRYHDLVGRTLDILKAADPDVLADASFDLDQMQELALDPRAYDHGHPVNRRPNQAFGEWDPHHIDGRGRYSRYVARQVTLDALLDRVEHPGDAPPEEALYEAAAVLAGTILMASGVSGGGPGGHDSTATLATLMPRIARFRDAFYGRLLDGLPGPHGERLRAEAARTRQPFGGARQHLNQYLARQRAAQLQQRHLTVLFAEMGYPEASRRQAAQIPAASIRFMSEIVGRLASAQLLVGRGDRKAAAALLPEIEDLLRRGIACGALADPWNVLGFQALFPLSPAQEDSVRDTRIDELIHVVALVFDLYGRLLGEAASAGEPDVVRSLQPAQRQLAAWWDRFATASVGDVRRVVGREAAESAENVADALALRRERGEAAADLAFWRQHLEGFRSPKAYALVVDALLRKQDYRASMALLVSWLGQAEQVPLGDAGYSFHDLALRWLLGLASSEDHADDPTARRHLAAKFLDYLEANAEDYGEVPALESQETAEDEEDEEEEDDRFGAAYEGVIYQDTADDDVEGSVSEGGPPAGAFPLESEAEPIAKRLHYLATLARLWPIAARTGGGAPADAGWQERLTGWLSTAAGNRQRLLALLDALHELRVPEPTGSHDSLVEYDRRRGLKDRLLGAVIASAVDTTLAAYALRGALGPAAAAADTGPEWGPAAVRLEQALLHADPEAARAALPDFVARFSPEPLLLPSLADGGHPRQAVRARIAQNVLHSLVAHLPRLGLLRETFDLLRTAHRMEQAHGPAGRRGVTEFNHLFQSGFQAVVRAVVESPAAWSGDHELVARLETLTRHFVALWSAHSQTLLLSSLETVRPGGEWQALGEFIRRYGRDLFRARFMTLGNLRGILQQGVGPYLDSLRDNPDPLRPVRLAEDLDAAIPRVDAARFLELTLKAVVENYDEYKDYNTSTTQSDYGENLHALLDFLLLKAGYERRAWQVRPLAMAHEVLARSPQAPQAALLWQAASAQLTHEPAVQILNRLGQLEQKHGFVLGTVRDRVEELLVKPLALDRLCALVEPAMEEARRPGPTPAFERLAQALTAWTARPAGVGLDVPAWLRRLEAEVQRARASRHALAALAAEQFRVPQRPLSREDLDRQLADWDQAGATEGGTP